VIAERDDVEWRLQTSGGKKMHGYHLPVVAGLPSGYNPSGYNPYWAVPLESVADGYTLGNCVLNPELGPFESRLLFRYRLFVRRQPWPTPMDFSGR